MGLNELIHQEFNIMPIEALSSFLKWLNFKKDDFEKSGIVIPNSKNKQVINEQVRKVKSLNLSLDTNSQTEIHWCNFLGKIILDLKNKYETKLNTKCVVEGINEINVLKYENSGHYNFHTDHCRSIPRTLSVILLLNNDYEGGDLVFKNIKNQSELLRVKPTPASAIIWPSNFMYPHKVEPITKGIRYSVVSWLL